MVFCYNRYIKLPPPKSWYIQDGWQERGIDITPKLEDRFNTE